MLTQHNTHSLLCPFNEYGILDGITYMLTKIKHIHHNATYLLVSIAGVSLLAWFMHTVTPNIYIIILFITLIVLVVWSFVMFCISSLRWAFTISAWVGVFVLLRTLHLREPLYILLFTVICILFIELTRKNR